MTRRVFRAFPASAGAAGFALTVTALPTPIAAAVAASFLTASPVFVWLVGSEVSDAMLIAGGSESYLSAETASGALPAGVTFALVSGRINFAGTPTEAGSGSITITVQDSNGLTTDFLVTWSVDAGAAATYIDVADGAVSSTDAGMTYATGVFTSSGPYGKPLSNAKTTPSFGEYFTITLPAGTYTGNVRLEILTNTLDTGVYDQNIFLETSDPVFSGNAIPVATYDYDIGPLTAGDLIYCPAGIDDGSGSGSGSTTFSLKFEAS